MSTYIPASLLSQLPRPLYRTPDLSVCPAHPPPLYPPLLCRTPPPLPCRTSEGVPSTPTSVSMTALLLGSPGGKCLASVPRNTTTPSRTMSCLRRRGGAMGCLLVSRSLPPRPLPPDRLCLREGGTHVSAGPQNPEPHSPPHTHTSPPPRALPGSCAPGSPQRGAACAGRARRRGCPQWPCPRTPWPRGPEREDG